MAQEADRSRVPTLTLSRHKSARSEAIEAISEVWFWTFIKLIITCTISRVSKQGIQALCTKCLYHTMLNQNRNKRPQLFWFGSVHIWRRTTAQCSVFKPNHEHFTCEIFLFLQRLIGPTQGIMQPRMVICGSFYHGASLSNRSIWRVVEGILETLPTPQVITELLKKWVKLLREKSPDFQGQEKDNRSSNTRSTGPMFDPLRLCPPPQTCWVWPYC